jgi:hypothetical protein
VEADLREKRSRIIEWFFVVSKSGCGIRQRPEQAARSALVAEPEPVVRCGDLVRRDAIGDVENWPTSA